MKPNRSFTAKPSLFLLAVWLLACSNPPAAPAAENAPHPEAVRADTPALGAPVETIGEEAKASPPESTAAPAPVAAKKNSGSKSEAALPPPPPPPATPAPPTPVEAPAPEPAPPAGLHDAWDQLLRQWVSADGKVNYKGFKNNKAALEAYLKTLAGNPPADDWSRSEKMAYWINAYNAFTIDLITDHYPLSSIMNLDGGKTWDVKRITLGGKKYSLNQIENEILRPQFKDARIHFAVNCAAKSCPPLYNRAYTAENLARTLEQRARQFINNTAFNTLSADKAQISKIFEWYAADFGDLCEYLNRYAQVKLNEGATIAYQEYNWDLNE